MMTLMSSGGQSPIAIASIWIVSLAPERSGYGTAILHIPGEFVHGEL